ncbi:hypothetical protein CS062_16350 [Roseateles chitinivorans]|uniref:Uncharacterized protein n=1 Tax=Roseateles chitinivorans TaxID=2917965 RepID=A0A2G9C6R7_9BURK|nr:hypothetical protein [Roseateles chitinivorans]PIM52123.1 hypothetical protein CS062_16350 [Roseateles chitinivorans]
MAPKPAWSEAKLRVVFGEIPGGGDELVVESTGRRCQVLRVAGKTLHCIVLPADAPVDPEAKVWSWRWAGHKKRGAA